MRRLVLLAVCTVLLFSFGCKKEEAQPTKPAAPRRMVKPGDGPETKPGGGAPAPAP
jgi:hypothetical protein